MGNCQCVSSCKDQKITLEEIPTNAENIYFSSNGQKAHPQQYQATTKECINASKDNQIFDSNQHQTDHRKQALEQQQKQSGMLKSNSMGFDLTKPVRFTSSGSNDNINNKLSIKLSSGSKGKRSGLLSKNFDDKLGSIFGIINKESESEKNIEIYENNIQQQLKFDSIDNYNRIMKNAEKRMVTSQKRSQLKDSKRTLSQNLQRFENDKFLEQEILCQLDKQEDQKFNMRDYEPTQEMAVLFTGKIEDLMSKEALQVLNTLPILEPGILPTDAIASHNYYEMNDTKNVYIGQWRNRKMNGHGKMYLRDGSIYEGNFYENDITGEGRMVYGNGDIYQGGFHQGKPHTKGNYIWKNQDNYKGEYLNGLKHGKGTFTKVGNTEVYTGQFFNDQRQGQGELTVKNLYQYKGEFLNNKMNGQGICEWPNIKSYNGTWKDNKMNGGQFKNDLFEGKGEFKNQDQSVYYGEWKEGKKNGNGVQTEINGEQYKE